MARARASRTLAISGVDSKGLEGSDTPTARSETLTASHLGQGRGAEGIDQGGDGVHMDRGTCTTVQACGASQQLKGRQCHVIWDLKNSLTAAFLRSLVLHKWILLAVLLRCVHRTGMSEIQWANVSHQHHLYAGAFADGAPLPCELEGVLDALLAVCVVLSEVRSARHIVLGCDPGEVSLSHVSRRIRISR
jgi:hypothetical protein